MKKILTMVAMVALFAASAMAQLDTKSAGAYGSSAQTSASVLFGAVPGQTVVTAINAWSDKAGAQLKLYARSGANRIAVSGASTALATVVTCANSASGLASNDTIVIQHQTGYTEYRTLNAASTTNIGLTAGTTYACAAGDAIYEVSQAALYYVGSNSALNLSGDVFATPADSPLYGVLDGTSNTMVNITVQR